MKRSDTRRSFVTALAGLAAATWTSFSQPTAVAPQHTPQPIPSPNAPKNQNVPGGLDSLPAEGSVRAPVATFNATQLVAMVQQLYVLADELKQETDRTNLKDTLPVDFIRRAQQIEKLAKSLREKARG